MKRIIVAGLTVSAFVAVNLAAGGVADAKKMKKMKLPKMTKAASNACLDKAKVVGRDEQRSHVCRSATA